MASLLPTVVLVHGAWHTPQPYQRYISALEARGFAVHCPQLPSCTSAKGSFQDDVSTVRAVVERLVNARQRVLMIMHSYGGMVGTDAVDGLTMPKRKAAGQPGGVIHLFYLCAYLVQPGQSIWSWVEEFGFAPLWPQVMDDASDGTTFPKDPALWLYGGVEPEVFERDLKPHLTQFPLAALRAEPKGTAWKDVPVTYVLTQQDYAVPRAFQDRLIAQALENGVSLRTEDYNTSHGIYVTMTDEMVEAAIRAVEDERNADKD